MIVDLQDAFGRRHRISAVDKGGRAELAGMESKMAIIQVSSRSELMYCHFFMRL